MESALMRLRLFLRLFWENTYLPRIPRSCSAHLLRARQHLGSHRSVFTLPFALQSSSERSAEKQGKQERGTLKNITLYAIQQPSAL